MTARGALATGVPVVGSAARRLGFASGVVLAGVAIGVAAVRSPTLAVAALVGVAFVAVAVPDLAGGLAFFVVLTFFDPLPGSPTTGVTLVKAAGVLLPLAWAPGLTPRPAAI